MSGKSKEVAYTAYEKMREKFSDLIKKEGLVAPSQPEVLKQYRIWETNDKGQKKSKPTFTDDVSDLEKKAVEFIRESCRELRFDPNKENLDDDKGTSLRPNQVPYNFQMDTDRRCLEVALHRFLESGMAKEAFDVYFCYLEMFIGSYGKTKKMIEMLSEFETNASSLLMKHRDHYSHSVYVFVIGLAFYQSSGKFRDTYKTAYFGENCKENENAVAAHFLKYWGLTALFHDIGYPFELSFEQVKSYFGDTIEYVPFVKFNMNDYQHSKFTIIKQNAEDMKELLSDKSKITDVEKDVKSFIEIVFAEDNDKKSELLKKISEQGELTESVFECLNKVIDEVIDEAGRKRDMFIEKLKNMSPNGCEQEDLNDFLANALYSELYEKKVESQKEKILKSLTDILKDKPEKPEKFNGYIDHAYFSSIMLLSNLLYVLQTKECNAMYAHCLTAILLHNSLFKFILKQDKVLGFDKGFIAKEHPLAYLLMLCDELQCWDRRAYGRSSRKEIHPYDCEFRFNENEIEATYIFDSTTYAREIEIGKYEINEDYKSVKGSYHKLADKGSSEGSSDSPNEKCKFLKDIMGIICLNDNENEDNSFLKLSTYRKFSPNMRYRSSSLSTSSFIHLYKFAVLVHQMNHLEYGKELNGIEWAKCEKKFEEMSLEYKINHISRAKKFARILQEIGCFYSDKPMDCELVTEFNEDEDLEEIMGPMEHERWSWEHWLMGWRSIDKKKFEELKREFREKYPESKLNIRECLKLHPDMPPLTTHYFKRVGISHYFMLDIDNPNGDSTKEKDKRSMRNLLNVLSKEDGIKIYRLKRG